MYFLSELPTEATAIAASLKERIADFFAPLAGRKVLISALKDPCEADPTREHLFLVTDGGFAMKRGDRTSAMIEEGDLFGLERIFGAEIFSLRSEFAVGVSLYRIDLVLKHAMSSPAHARQWSEILTLSHSLFELALHFTARENSDPVPAVRQYKAGDEIIIQGSRTTDIFTMVEGHAEVIVDGVRVGEVLNDEIFGALAAFSDTPRTATVKATSDCVALALPAEQFLGLMASRPATVVKLIQDMSRALSASNKVLVARF